MDNNDFDNDYSEISDILEEMYPEKNFYYINEDYNDAIVGVSGNKLVYSKSLIIDILCETMEIDEAISYYTDNIENAFYGDKTPIFIDDDILYFLDDSYDDFPIFQISPN